MKCWGSNYYAKRVGKKIPEGQTLGTENIIYPKLNITSPDFIFSNKYSQFSICHSFMFALTLGLSCSNILVLCYLHVEIRKDTPHGDDISSKYHMNAGDQHGMTSYKKLKYAFPHSHSYISI